MPFVDVSLVDFERLEKCDEFQRLIACVERRFDIVGTIGDDTQSTPDLQFYQSIGPHALIDEGHGLP